MTREEAIKNLQFVRNYLDDTSKMAISFDMAIKALEQEPCEPVLSHSELTRLIYVYFGGEKYEITKQAIEAVRAIQEPMRDATQKELASVNDYIKSISKPTGINFYDAEFCEDAISREAVIEQINEWCVKEWNYTNATEYLHKRIKALPNVTPKEKVGHWIIDDVISTWVCSECKKTRIDNRIDHMKYCNSCGARMENT